MQIQPITSQPNFNGKVVLDRIYTPKELESPEFKLINKKIKEVAALVQDKPYDLFIFKNKQNPEFFEVAANKTIQKAKAVREYTVKISPSIMLASVVDAAKDAMEMYEKYIMKGVKG